MKYYLIVGEASGDLHASHLMAALKLKDAQAEFRFFGGNLMMEQGGELVCHYRDLAFMGIISVLMHLPTILKGMELCKRDICQWKPDAVILVDYPGFNLKIAKYIKSHTEIPVYYYISPKIWAWKEYRIKEIRRYVDKLFSILPFEVDFFEKKHNYPIHYVGNPTMDEVHHFLQQHPADEKEFRRECGLDERPIIALLSGSRRQEIKDNLPRMIAAAESYSQRFQLVLATAPGIEDEYYDKWLQKTSIKRIKGQTFDVLRYSVAALVTSGTATLETALFKTPQVVCYYMKAGWLVSIARRLILKIPYVSLVNLIAGYEAVPELIAGDMTIQNIRRHLESILPDGSARTLQLKAYEDVAEKLGSPGAPQNAAAEMVALLSRNTTYAGK